MAWKVHQDWESHVSFPTFTECPGPLSAALSLALAATGPDNLPPAEPYPQDLETSAICRARNSTSFWATTCQDGRAGWSYLSRRYHGH